MSPDPAELIERVRTAVPNPLRWARSAGFPYTAASTPRGVEPPARRNTLGDFYDSDWARSPLARWSRVAAVETVGRAVAEVTCHPSVINVDRVSAHDGPVVFVANHQSHLDTTLLLTSIPLPWRHELVVAAAADYFFDSAPKAALAAWAYGAVPMERKKVSRRSADRATGLLAEGWSLLIFPEGGRSPDGWGQEHKAGAAFLSVRCGVPVVPIHLDGVGRVLPKGSGRPNPGNVTINFGAPIAPAEGEDAKSLVTRLEAAIATLADETSTDWYSAKRRAHEHATPSLRGPTTSSWRRDWTAPERRPGRRAAQRWPF